MKKKTFAFLIIALIVILTACVPAEPAPTTAPVVEEVSPPTATPTAAPTIPPIPTPTEDPLAGWSTSASTRSGLSFAFPGNWDGSSPLTFGEGEFVKDPQQPLGVTFQINLGGSPQDLLSAWGNKQVGIVGISTFTPETIEDAGSVTIARVDCLTKLAKGEGITAQVAYIKRKNDVMEIMWFAPSGQWQAMQPIFEQLLAGVELWNVHADRSIGLQTMYVHDWNDPQPAWVDQGLWFQSADETTGLVIFVIDEIADPVERLNAWKVDRLDGLGFTECTLEKGDRMDTMSGQWESKTGACKDNTGTAVRYEVSYVPDKDRLLEMITYAPAGQWEDANKVAFKSLLGMMIDIR